MIELPAFSDNDLMAVSLLAVCFLLWLNRKRQASRAADARARSAARMVVARYQSGDLS